jgi:hypothetical protein
MGGGGGGAGSMSPNTYTPLGMPSKSKARCDVQKKYLLPI